MLIRIQTISDVVRVFAVSDVFSEWALRQTVKFLPRVAKDKTDMEARSSML